MTKTFIILLSLTSIFLNFNSAISYSFENNSIVFQRGTLEANNIRTYFNNAGIFNRSFVTNSAGFEWPKGSGKNAIFSSGITTSAFVQGVLKMASASYHGEYAPGYANNTTGTPVAITNSTFRIYNVRRTDIPDSNNWKNWGLMIPFGAPYNDVNHNGHYEYFIDTPGVKGAEQTIFMCITDGFPEEHKLGEGFGGGTAPLFAEVHLTAWAYNNPGLEDVIFIKWESINKNVNPWNGTFFSLVCIPDLGIKDDNYIGCDTLREMSYCYNATNYDSIYGSNPPAVGIKWLECTTGNPLSKSYVYFREWNANLPVPCESSFNINAYNLMKGVKNDLTPWVLPPGGNVNLITKACYSGDPESGTGWNEGLPGNPTGSVQNCGGPNALTGSIVNVNPSGYKFILMNKGGVNFTMNPNDTQRIVFAQLIARGTNNLNSVTKLKQLADNVQQFFNNGFVIGIEPESKKIPVKFVLHQNYPNPFNPTTKIKFDVVPPLNPLLQKEGTVRSTGVVLTIYDILGKEIEVLVNEQLSPGTYEVEWNASNYSSGVYFYSLSIDGKTQTKKMVLIK